ncbi:MAG: helix-turn-helix domain-containing protein [Patescibacteria group bacterium]|nr:helix-turn-helix domain-containing protein [Patescibacteria group bacterium]
MTNQEREQRRLVAQKLWQQGYPLSAIARHLGITKSTAFAWTAGKGITATRSSSRP